MSSAERAVARIDLAAIERNCARLPKPLCAVVKANAYGHGAVAAAEAALAGGATWLGVAAAGEAAELRAAGIGAPVLVMGALTRDELRTALEADADVVAWTRGGRRGRPARAREARHRDGRGSARGTASWRCAWRRGPTPSG